MLIEHVLLLNGVYMEMSSLYFFLCVLLRYVFHQKSFSLKFAFRFVFIFRFVFNLKKYLVGVKLM